MSAYRQLQARIYNYAARPHHSIDAEASGVVPDACTRPHFHQDLEGLGRSGSGYIGDFFAVVDMLTKQCRVAQTAQTTLPILRFNDRDAGMRFKDRVL
jgi:hypothetical protein